MQRPIPNPSERKKLVHSRGNACHVCDYSLRPALRVHHIVPVSLGGGDEPSNLVLVCASCHSLIHYFGTKARNEKPLPKYLANELPIDAVRRLQTLVSKLQYARRKAYRTRNVAHSLTLEQAISKVATRGRFDDEEKASYRDCLQAVLKATPPGAIDRCSFRLLRGGKYISINLMNYLVYRSPAYGDLGRRPRHDCYVIFPNRLGTLTRLPNPEDRVVFQFAHFDCITLGLAYEELLAFSTHHWNLFRQACMMAVEARPSRKWPSNILIQRR